MKPNSNKTLSKSKLMRGVQCPKNLWLHLYKSELEGEVDAATQAQFDEGNEVGELAREHAGRGVLIEADYWDYQKAHDLTQAAIRDGEKLIFEASFLKDGLYARADILKKDKKGWHLIEVKKSTQVKDYHYKDAGIQAMIIESTGLALESISIMFINNEAVFPNLENLFASEDITEKVRLERENIETQVKELIKFSVLKTEPRIKIGPHCDDPFECPFKQYCWKEVPEKSVFDLPALSSEKKWTLFKSGKTKIIDLDPKDYKNKTKRAIEVTKTGKLWIEKEAIRKELSEWQWPLYFFDFETLGPAIPRYEGTRPYNQVPFQFSCHVWESQKSKSLGHFEYLHQEATDPRNNLTTAMLDGLGSKGSIVSYNKTFEIGVIKKLGEVDKKNRAKLMALIDRFVDPLPLFQKHVYHPDFLGSFSIKAVAPALLGNRLSYEHLEVGDGSTAQALAEKILRGQMETKDQQKVVADLLEYCRQDTMAMVELVKWLIMKSEKK